MAAVEQDEGRLDVLVTDPASHRFETHSIVCSATEAAVDMLTVRYAQAVPGVELDAVDPGRLATDLHGDLSATSPAVGAEVVARRAGVGTDGPPARRSWRSRLRQAERDRTRDRGEEVSSTRAPTRRGRRSAVLRCATPGRRPPTRGRRGHPAARARAARTPATYSSGRSHAAK